MNRLQAPQLLTDVYRDLRDRRLLALTAVILVAIVVVPVALSSSPSRPASSEPAIPGPIARKSAPRTLQVSASVDGLRDYRRRLKGDVRNPFDQQYTEPVGLPPATFGQPSSSSADMTALSSTPSSAGTAPTTTPESFTLGGGSAPETITNTTTKTETEYVSYRIDVRTGLAGQKLDRRNDIENLTPLPSEEVPALAFIGVSMDSALNAKRASFLVSSSVSAIAGEGRCVLGSPQCQLLTLKAGQHVDVVWADGLTYRVTLLKFESVTRDQLPSPISQRRKRSKRS
jgi:hypothetical protein